MGTSRKHSKFVWYLGPFKCTAPFGDCAPMLFWCPRAELTLDNLRGDTKGSGTHNPRHPSPPFLLFLRIPLQCPSISPHWDNGSKLLFSWTQTIRDLCKGVLLPHPFVILIEPVINQIPKKNKHLHFSLSFPLPHPQISGMLLVHLLFSDYVKIYQTCTVLVFSWKL